MYTPRQRIREALNHREPDRVPIDLGGWQSGISYETYEPLKELLEIKSETRIEERVQGLAWVDEPVLEMFGVDTRYIFPHSTEDIKREELADNSFFDEWGVKWERLKNSHYYDIVFSPLEEAEITGIDMHKWPQGISEERKASLKQEVEELARAGFALFTSLAGVFEQATYLRSMERFYTDIIYEPKFFEALLDKVLEVEISMYEKFFDAVGDRLDVVEFWGDLGSQQGPLISPDHYRKYVKSREVKLVEFAKKHTNAKICFHSCGSVYDFIPDVIDGGYELLNPVQTSAAHMEPERLKGAFGKDIVFWGAIDTQRVLPFGNDGEVRSEVKRMIQTFGKDGGYILAPCHNIQALTPPENVVAMFAAAKENGRYPL